MKRMKTLSKPAVNRSASNLLSNRTKQYNKYVKDQAKRRVNNAVDEPTAGSTISSRLKQRSQGQQSVNRISKTLAPLMVDMSPYLK